MNKFTILKSIVAPLDCANVDTDIIIPKQYLKSIKRSGFGENLFDEWRYCDTGYIGIDNSKREINHDFVLNKSQYKSAKILLTRENFGCGSSREHAAWALENYGFKAIIAPSFADIFYNNCFKNGLLPIVQSKQIVDELFNNNGEIEINLATQTITTDGASYEFIIDSERKRRLLGGLDDIDITLSHSAQITTFEKSYFNKYPWL